MKKSMLTVLPAACLLFIASLSGCEKSDTGGVPTSTTEQPNQANPATPNAVAAPGTESSAAQTTATAALAAPAPTPAPTPEVVTTSTITASDAKVTFDFVAQLPQAQFTPTKEWAGRISSWTPVFAGARYRGLLAHAPARVAFTGISIDRNSVLEFAPLIDPDKSAGSDGVVFTVTVKPEGGDAATVFEREVKPGANAEDRQLKAVDVPLGQFAGKTVEIQFITANKPEKHNYSDTSVFVDPKIIDKPGMRTQEPAAGEKEASPKTGDGQAKADATDAAGNQETKASPAGATKTGKRKSRKQN